MSNFQKLSSFSQKNESSKGAASDGTDFNAFKLSSQDVDEAAEKAAEETAGFSDFAEDDFDFSSNSTASSANGFSHLADAEAIETSAEPVFELDSEEDRMDSADFALFSKEPASSSVSKKKANAVPVKTKGNGKKPAIIAACAALGVAAIVGGSFLIFGQPSSPYPFDNGVEEITQQNVDAVFAKSFTDIIDGKQVTIDTEGNKYDIVLSDYDFAYAPGGKVENEYVDVPLEDGSGYAVEKIAASGCVSYNETKVNEFIERVASEYGDPMKLPYYTIEGDRLRVFAGVDGMSVDFDDLIKKLVGSIENQDFSTAAVALGVLKAPDVDMEKIYHEVACEPVDASYTVSDKGVVTYIDEIIGKDFDLAAATVQVQTPADHWDIKLALTYPDVTVKKLKAPTCPDLLSTMSTKYSTGNKNRSNNLELAASYINGIVLQPGEVFSFNSTVGKRTAERGFKKAGVYTGEGLDEDYGGGICQTSTTLYGACLYANLEIVERRNHYYTVSYWKMAGTDATVSWGSCDYKFKNSKEYPIKIVFECHNGTITCKLYGTEDGYTAYIKNEVSNYTTYETIHKPKDGSKSNSHGANGMTVQTYRYICKNGEVVEKVKEAKSVYRPLNAIVYDGETSSSASKTTTTAKTTKSTTKTTKSTTTTTKTTTTTTAAAGE